MKIVDELLRYKIIRPNKNKAGYHRAFNWKSCFNNDITDLWNTFVEKYRTEDEAWYCITHNIIERPTCPLCGAINKFVGGKKGYNLTCDNCSANSLAEKKEKAKITYANHSDEFKEKVKLKTKVTLLEKYGDENYGHYGSASFKNKMEDKYGDKHYSNHKKAQQTCLEKYGVSSNLCINAKERTHRIWKEQHDSIIAKRQQTSLQRYNKLSPNQDSDVQRKMQETKQSHISEFEKESDCTLFASLLKDYGQGWLSLGISKIFHNGHTYISNKYLNEIINYSAQGTYTNQYTSKPEKEIAEFIKNLGIQVEENVTNIVPNNNHRFYELDIYLPDYKVAIEFNGSYWHSILFKDKNYHLRKTQACEKVGIRLIHIFEDLWNTKKDIYKSIIRSILNNYDTRIYARDCEVKEITNEEYSNFLEANHLQGCVNSTNRFGLVYNNELVQVIGFGKSRFKKGEIELYRMCTKKYTQIIGGFSKLIKHCGIDKFISYVDRSIYNGNGYNNAGFKIIGETPPSYFYVKDSIRLNRLQCQKHKLKKLLLNYNENLTEQENMLNNNYLQIYDCGNLKLEYIRSEK